MKQERMNLEVRSKDIQIVNICKAYWDFDDSNYNFKHRVDDIAIKHQISRPSVTGIIRANSSLSIFCESCKNVIKNYSTRSEINFDNIVLNDRFLCFDCRKNCRLSKKIATRDEMIIILETGVKKQEWKKLDIRELELLTIISKCKTKKDIMRQVFQGMNYKSEYSKLIWKRLNLLEEMGLLWIERSENRQIIDYHTSGELRTILEKQYPQYFGDEDISSFETLQIMLQKIPLKTTQKQPDYSGYFNVKKEVLLKPNSDYSYGAWLNDDGSIFFKIEPADKKYIKSDKKTDLNLEE